MCLDDLEVSNFPDTFPLSPAMFILFKPKDEALLLLELESFFVFAVRHICAAAAVTIKTKAGGMMVVVVVIKLYAFC